MNQLDKSIHDVQEEILYALVKIHNYCIQNEINYSLHGGTLIGAVREHGFIDWDDDADIGFLRDEYEKFFMSEAAVEAMVSVNEEATPASQGDAEGLVAKMKKYASAAPEAISKKIASLNEKLRAMEKAEQDKGADRGVLSKMKEKIIAAVRYLTDLLKKKKSEAAAPAQA